MTTPTKYSVSRLGEPLASQIAPFAAFLDADEPEWANARLRLRWIRELLEAGCRYFVCFGDNAESLHDCIDRVIVAGGHQEIITTFHDDESPAEVAEFFNRVAAAGMANSIVLVADPSKWNKVFSDGI